MSSAPFDQLFRAVRREVDDVLSEVPQSLLGARRLVTQEMRFEPRPEELQAIVKIAGFMSTSVVCYELSRQMLALRVIAERELDQYWGARKLSAESLARTTRIISELLLADDRSAADLVADGETMSSLEPGERELLIHLSDVLALPRERLEAATTIAPRLELFADQASRGTMRELFPGLSEDEIAMFDQAILEDDGSEDGPGRVCLDAIALRTFFEEYYELWQQTGSDDDDERLTQLRQSVREQLAAADAAYRILTERLQLQQDEAICANLDDFGGEIRKVKSKLFEAYTKTRSMLRDANGLAVTIGGSGPSEAARLTEGERAEPELTRKISRDELFRDALTSLRRDRKSMRDRDMHPLAIARRFRIRRAWAFSLVIAALALAALGVQWLLPQRAANPVTVSLKEFQPSLSVVDARPIGSMLYVRVSDWGSLSAEKVRFRTAEIGELAAAKGLALAYVVSDQGRGLSEWHANGGVLVKTRPGGSQDVISRSESFNRADPGR